MDNTESISTWIEQSKYIVKFNNSAETKRIVFGTTDKSLCTYIGDNPEEVKKKQDFLILEGIEIALQDFILREIRKESVFLQQKNTDIIYESGESVTLTKGLLKVEAVFKEGIQYAFYLQKDQDIERIFYKANNTHDFFIRNEGMYILTFFYKDKNGEKTIQRNMFLYSEKDGITIV